MSRHQVCPPQGGGGQGRPYSQDHHPSCLPHPDDAQSLTPQGLPLPSRDGSLTPPSWPVTCSCWCNGRPGDRPVSTWWAPAFQYTLPCCCPGKAKCTLIRPHSDVTAFRRHREHRETPDPRKNLGSRPARPPQPQSSFSSGDSLGFPVYIMGVVEGELCPAHLTPCSDPPTSHLAGRIQEGTIRLDIGAFGKTGLKQVAHNIT